MNTVIIRSVELLVCDVTLDLPTEGVSGLRDKVPDLRSPLRRDINIIIGVYLNFQNRLRLSTGRFSSN